MDTSYREEGRGKGQIEKEIIKTREISRLVITKRGREEGKEGMCYMI